MKKLNKIKKYIQNYLNKYNLYKKIKLQMKNALFVMKKYKKTQFSVYNVKNIYVKNVIYI